MPKLRSGAKVYVADGDGGMRPVVDARFETGEWPVELDIPTKDADVWMAHLTAEAEERGWTSSSFWQLDRAENSGTLSVHTNKGPSPTSLEIVWEKIRGEELKIRARPSGEPILPVDVIRQFINAVDERQRAGKTLCAYRRSILTYNGLPWRGVLWLDDNHRLGPPSKHPDSLLGPQAVVVDAMVEGIGTQGVNSKFQARLQELRLFLSFTLGINIKTSRFENGWVSEIDSAGQIKGCALKQVGYVETEVTTEMPGRDNSKPIARRHVTRPGLGPMGITSDVQEPWVPQDIEELWETFCKLPTLKREHLLRSANAYRIARSMWPEQRTSYVAFLVVACEALKPRGNRYDSMNVYDVVASLVDNDMAQHLRRLAIHPQKVRSDHFHRGQLTAGELFPVLANDYFADPSFDELLRELSWVCRMCLIEWLRCKGEYEAVRLPRRPRFSSSIWQWVTRHIRPFLKGLG